MSEKISVVVPIYKVEKYLKKCVDSLISQTYQDLEIILVDDGSPDACPAICAEYAKKDSRIKVIHKENGGLSSARNMGLDVASGEYVTFIDSDDFLASNACEYLLGLIKKYDADFAMCSVARCKEGEESINNKASEKITLVEGDDVLSQLQSTTIDLLCIACAKLYKRELFDDIRYPLGRVHEDEFVLHKCLYKTKRFVHSSLPLYNYLIRGDSIMSSRNDKELTDALDAFGDRYEFLETHCPNDDRNASIYLAGLRGLWLRLIPSQKKYATPIFEKYKKIYKKCQKKSKKERFFRYFRHSYKFLHKIRTLSGEKRR